MNMKIYLTIEERDKCGRWISRKKTEANSLVMGFIDMLAGLMGAQTLTITDFGGTGRSVTVNAANFLANAGAGTITYGIRVGTGSTAVAVTDTTLVTAIAHGNSAGQLAHGANSVGAPLTSGTSRQFTISRTFTNNTASTITPNEVCLIGQAAGQAWYIMLDRTLNTFAITAGASKTVTYTIKVTV